MINSQMAEYQYYLYSDQVDVYGQHNLIKDDNGEPVIQGTVKLAINTSSTAIQQNIRYKEAAYIALTMDANISDKYVILYGDERLKVLYVTPQGRYKQVFLSTYG